MRVWFLISFVIAFAARVDANRFSLSLFEKEKKNSSALAQLFQEKVTEQSYLQVSQHVPSLFDMGEDVPLSRIEEFAASLLEKRWVYGLAQVFSDSFSADDTRMGASLRVDLSDLRFQFRYRFNF